MMRLPRLTFRSLLYLPFTLLAVLLLAPVLVAVLLTGRRADLAL